MDCDYSRSSLRNLGASCGDCTSWIYDVDDRADAWLPSSVSNYVLWRNSLLSLSFADQVNREDISNDRVSRVYRPWFADNPSLTWKSMETLRS